MRLLRPIVLVGTLAIMLFGNGCAAQLNNAMNSWIGHQESELIASWGPPNSTASDGSGGHILIYQSYVNLGQTPGQVTYGGGNSYYYTAPQQQGYGRSRMFYVHSDGMIYNWRWQGM